MNRDSLSGLALLALAAGYYWASRAIADSTLSDEVGATGLPNMLVVALAGLGLILIAQAMLGATGVKGRETRPAAAEQEEREAAKLPRALGFLMFGAAYVLLLPYIGYFLGVALLIAGIALYEGAPRRWTIPAAALGAAVLYWAVFVKLLGVNQPAGLLFQRLFS